MTTIAKNNTSDRELVITRSFNAPRELVFKAWTDPSHVVHWWGPNGFTITIHEMRVKPGGVWRFIMHGPDGIDYPNRIVFQEVIKPERLVFLHGADIEDDPGQFHVEVDFIEEGKKTELVMRMIFKTKEAKDLVVEKYGAIEGNRQTMNRLEEYLEDCDRSYLDDSMRKLNITRILNAPRELVFKAWIDEKCIAQWWGPKGFTNPVCQMDVRPGGSIRIDMMGPGAVVYPMGGTFHEIKEPELLVFTSTAYTDEQGNHGLEVLNTVKFEEHHGKTRLTLNAVVVNLAPEVKPAVRGMEQGWNETLDRLAQVVVK